jgi:hypothetical protein
MFESFKNIYLGVVKIKYFLQPQSAYDRNIQLILQLMLQHYTQRQQLSHLKLCTYTLTN